jgi:hypothetical protein
MAANTDPVSSGLTLLTTILTGDSTFMGYITGVFQDIAPIDTPADYCLIGVQSPGLDTLTATGVRVLSRPLFRVKIVGPAADMATLSAAYQRADTLLALVRNDAATGILACYREAPLYLPEPQLINGEAWVNLGGLYRMEM